MKKKWVLLNPGPVNVTPRVRQALLCPDVCHREPEFSQQLLRVQKKLLSIFSVKTTHEVALVTGSGTSALEAMLGSFAEKDEKVLVLSNGVYGERMQQILAIHNVKTKIISAALGHFPSIHEIENTLRSDRAITAIGMVHHETSTGMLNPAAAVAQLARRLKKKILLDAVSSLGAEKLNVSAFDYVAGTSGKCLHGFPGVSFIFVSKKESLRAHLKKPKAYYLNLWNILALEKKGDTPFTPAVQIYSALEEALDELADGGLSQRIQSYAKKMSLLEKGFENLGLRFVVDKRFRSHVLCALWTPAFISYQTLHDQLKKKGFIIYAGQSKLSGKIFRVSNLGDIRESDIRRFILELSRVIRPQ